MANTGDSSRRRQHDSVMTMNHSGVVPSRSPTRMVGSGVTPPGAFVPDPKIVHAYVMRSSLGCIADVCRDPEAAVGRRGDHLSEVERFVSVSTLHQYPGFGFVIDWGSWNAFFGTQQPNLLILGILGRPSATA